MQTKFPSKLFHTNHEAKVISAEISELQAYELPSVMGIVSGRTGFTEFFCHAKTHKDADGDVTYIEYHAMSPKLAGWSVYVYND